MSTLGRPSTCVQPPLSVPDLDRLEWMRDRYGSAGCNAAGDECTVGNVALHQYQVLQNAIDHNAG